MKETTADRFRDIKDQLQYAEGIIEDRTEWRAVDAVVNACRSLAAIAREQQYEIDRLRSALQSRNPD